MVERPIELKFIKITRYGRKAYSTQIYINYWIWSKGLSKPICKITVYGQKAYLYTVKRPIQHKFVTGYGQKAYQTQIYKNYGIL